MRSFVLRERSTPVDGAALLASVGSGAHSEILAHVLMNALFTAQSHRPGVVVHLVLEKTADYSRTISFHSDELGELGGFHEHALLGTIAHALDASRGMGKEECRAVAAGITVRTTSFEKLLAELAADHPLFVMDRKGKALGAQEFPGNPCFILTDHLPMPKNSAHGLARLGATRISLGPRMLFASQCVVLIHHALDCRERAPSGA